MSNRHRPRSPEGAAPVRRSTAVLRALAIVFAVFTIFARSPVPASTVARAAAITHAHAHAQSLVAAVRAGERHAEKSAPDRHGPGVEPSFLGVAGVLSVPGPWVVRELDAYRRMPERFGVARPVPAIARGPPSLSTS